MSGRADALAAVPGLAELARQQADTVLRSQLAALGVTGFHVLAQVRAVRWREAVPGVIVLHCGPLPPLTRRWVAVLAAGPGSALAAWTALELRGLRGWERQAIHVVVRRGRHVPRMPGVVVHESRRHSSTDALQCQGLPAHAVERAAVDAGAWSGKGRSAAGLMAAVVQQGLARPESLRRSVDQAGRIAFRRTMFLALADIEGGSQALSEIDLVRLCRRAGLPMPTRQRLRRDVNGRRRYLDAEWTLPSGSVVVLEIDGVGHLGQDRWYDDLLREAELVLPSHTRVIRLPAAAIRHEPGRVIAILSRALGVDRAA